jgi:hypothetical protein
MAGQKQQGEYRIHYNAFMSTTLTPDIARRVGVQRSGGTGVMLVNIRRDARGQFLGDAVSGSVEGRVRDLLGNGRDLTFREVREAGVVDYIAQFPVRNDDLLIFDLEVRPDDGPMIPVQARQALYPE